jgi:hypothetical protein
MLSKFRQMTLALTIVAATSLPASAASTTLLPLGNLFDDGAATPIATAIGTDTYGANAQTSDLGVEVVIDQSNALPLNTAQTIAPGVSFDYSSVGGGTAFPRLIRNDAWGDVAPIRTTGTATGYNAGAGKLEDGIGIHANGAITFNLQELRAAGLHAAASLFSAYFDQNDDQAANGSFRGTVVVSDALGNVLAGYVNGQKQAVVNNAGVWSFTGAIPAKFTSTSAQTSAFFDILIGADIKYLTLAALGGININTDHVAFVDANLTTFVPTPAALPAGLMLLTFATLKRRR